MLIIGIDAGGIALQGHELRFGYRQTYCCTLILGEMARWHAVALNVKGTAVLAPDDVKLNVVLLGWSTPALCIMLSILLSDQPLREDSILRCRHSGARADFLLNAIRPGSPKIGRRLPPGFC